MDTKDKTNMQIEEQENVLNPKDKYGAQNEVYNVG